MARKSRKSAPPAARPAARARRRVPLGLVAVVAVAAGYVALAWTLRFTQDDAYISLRYARNLVEGHGLVFNPGERVEGYSNFAWTVLMAAAMRLGAEPVAASQWTGILFGILSVLVAARFARALEGRWGVGAIAAAAFVAGNPAFALWSTGGLETSMFAFLVVLGLERGLAPGVGPRGRAAAPLVLALAALTRPEGPLFFVLWLAVRALDTFRGGPCADPRGRAGLVRDAVVFAAPLVPYAAWKLWYFGDLLPNPFYAKTGTSLEHLRLGFAYARDYAGSFGIFGVAPLLAAASLLRDGTRGTEARLLAIWIVWGAYVVLVGGDVLYLHRFWLHVLPLGAVLLGRGATEVAARVLAPPTGDDGARGRPPRVAHAATGLALAAALVGWGAWKNVPSAQERRETETGFVRNMQQTGEWLRENLPAGSTVAITTIGAISYHSRLRILDMLGLTDREIAREPKMIEGLTDTWREVQYNAESVLRRRPDFIFFSTSIRPSSAAEKALFLHEWFLKSYYPYYFRSRPYRQSIQNGFRIRPDAGPFDPARVGTDDVAWIDFYSEGHLAKSKEHDNAKAVELFRQSMEAAPPEFRWAEEWWAVSRYDSDDPGAVGALREAARKDPFATIARGRLADHAMRTGDLAEAERISREILAVDPDDNLPWMGLAEIARVRGDLDEAYRCSSRAIALWNVNPVHLVLHGSLAMAAGDLEIARNALRRALAARPDPGTAERARQGLEVVEAIRAGKIRPQDVRAAMGGSAPAAGDAP